MEQRSPKHDRVRESYNVVAREYADHFGDELSHKPLDRALLGAVAEQTAASASIADVGCGPGHVAAWLANRGRSVVGIDLSPNMVEVGRRLHPEVEFREGDLLHLPAADAEFGAVIAFYSIIHLESSELRPGFKEMRRVLRPDGRLLVSFHVGTEVRHFDQWWGHEVDLDFRFLETDAVIAVCEASGLVVEAQLMRTNYPEEVATRRAYLLARRRA